MEFLCFLLLPGSIENGNYSTEISSIYNCLFTPESLICISILFVLLNFLHDISLPLYSFLKKIMEKIISISSKFHRTNNPDKKDMKGNFFYFDIVKFIIKDI